MFLWLDVAGLLPQVPYIFEEGRFLAVEVRKLILDPIHDIGRRLLWADFQDADDEGTVLFEIRRVVPQVILEGFLVQPQPLVSVRHGDADFFAIVVVGTPSDLRCFSSKN